MHFRTLALLLLTLLASASISHAALNLNNREDCLSQPPLQCTFTATPGYEVTGTVYFTPVFRADRKGRKCLVRIQAKLFNVPHGLHGFHMHTYGDNSLADATSYGGHFTNPGMRDVPHGLPGDKRRHWGDFGSIFANMKRRAKYDRVDHLIKMRGIVGRGMVLHENADLGADAQPSGAAGPRLAGCVVGIANPSLLPM